MASKGVVPKSRSPYPRCAGRGGTYTWSGSRSSTSSGHTLDSRAQVISKGSPLSGGGCNKTALASGSGEMNVATPGQRCGPDKHHRGGTVGPAGGIPRWGEGYQDPGQRGKARGQMCPHLHSLHPKQETWHIFVVGSIIIEAPGSWGAVALTQRDLGPLPSVYVGPEMPRSSLTPRKGETTCFTSSSSCKHPSLGPVGS